VLIGEPERRLPLFPGRLAFFKQAVIEPATRFQLVIEKAALRFGRGPAVRDRLTQVSLRA
jgi:hypothetical protein